MSRSVAGRSVDGRAVRVHVEQDRIAAIESVPWAPDLLLTPGLVDLQVNGYGGFDVNADDVDAETLLGLATALVTRGTTAFCPTIITASPAATVRALTRVAAAVGRHPLLARTVLGVHLEGPYLSPLDGPRGAHDIRHLRDPDLAELGRWQEAACGLVAIITLAPELPGATAYIRGATDLGIHVSIGHSDADPAQISAAADAGADLSTHLGNGVRSLLPRHPNLIWSQLGDDRLSSGFIADGHHLPAAAFTAMVRAKSPSRSFLVSDSVALAGAPAGSYRTPVGGTVTVTGDGRLTLADSGLMAGSGACLAECLRWARDNSGIALADLLAMATANPCRLVGIAGRGVLAVGGRADLVLFDDTFSARTTMVAGEVVHQVGARA